MLYDYGAFNVSLINDLPLFVDPFLLFNSTKAEYRALHEDVISSPPPGGEVKIPPPSGGSGGGLN